MIYEDIRNVSVTKPVVVKVMAALLHTHYHVSLSFFTVMSPPPEPAPAPDAATAAGPPVPRMVDTSPCMKAQGGLLGELSRGQRSPLGQYTSPSPLRLWMYPLVHGKQNLVGRRCRVRSISQ